MLRETQVLMNRLRGYARIGRIKLPIDRSILSLRTEKTLARGKYERQEAIVACALVQSGDVVLELGAGLGYISAFIRCSTHAGRIVVYEANPDLIPYIRAVHRANDASDIDVRHGIVMAAPAAKSAPLYIRADVRSSSLSAEHPFVRAVDVPIVALSDVLVEVRPTTAVVDIEGAEIDLLEAEDLGSLQRLAVEIHPGLYGTDGVTRTLSALDRHGFTHRPSASCEQVYAFERQARTPI